MPRDQQRYILVVDDDEFIRLIFTRAFEGQDEQFVLDVAKTVGEALDKIKVMAYDLVFLDMHMGTSMAGMEVLEELRVQEIKMQAHGIPFHSSTVIIMTGSVSINDFSARARELEAFHLIEKPTPMTEEFIRRVVNRFGVPLLPRRTRTARPDFPV